MQGTELKPGLRLGVIAGSLVLGALVFVIGHGAAQLGHAVLYADLAHMGYGILVIFAVTMSLYRTASVFGAIFGEVRFKMAPDDVERFGEGVSGFFWGMFALGAAFTPFSYGAYLDMWGTDVTVLEKLGQGLFIFSLLPLLYETGYAFREKEFPAES